MKIFITGTFKDHEWNREFNPKLAVALEARGHETYVPQRDTEQKGIRKNTFEQNRDGVKNADALIAIGVNLMSANWGFEVGVAHGMNKPVVILTNDPSSIPLMTEGAAKEIFVPENIEDIESYVDELINLINL